MDYIFFFLGRFCFVFPPLNGVFILFGFFELEWVFLGAFDLKGIRRFSWNWVFNISCEFD